MKWIFLFVLIPAFLFSKASKAIDVETKISFNDTLYIFLKPDDRYHNQINANPDSLRFSVYGFVRDDRPKDWLDAAGYLAMYIGLEKGLAGVCDECSCKQHLERKMISLYDLRDTLKSSLMVFKGRRESLIDASPLLKRKTVILVTESNLKYYLHRVKYVDGFTRASD